MSEPLRDRLRRLRRDAPPRAAELEPDRGSSGREDAAFERDDAPVSSIERATPPIRADAFVDEASVGPSPATALGASEIRHRLARRASLAREREPEPADARRAPTLGPPAGLAPSGASLARVSTYARTHVHGTRALCDGLAYDAAALAAASRDERFASIDLGRALFLDTETTGLSGGAGTYVFLVGLGAFVREEFAVWQGFLDDPRNERALLAETAERIASASALVSFFGKSFDRHRLEDKMRMHGVTPPFADVPHLDLYWPLRRAHQGTFENCRLKTLERELAGVVRDDDLPGSFAPAAWFDFLQARPHRLEGVFRHNLEDVLSLVALVPHAAVAPVPRTTKRATQRAAQSSDANAVDARRGAAS